MTRFSRKAIREAVLEQLHSLADEFNIDYGIDKYAAKYRYDAKQLAAWHKAQGIWQALRMIDCFGYQED